jgi:UDP-glucose 4-epimerase
MRTLVTGGAGFIGSHIVDLLIAGGHRPLVVDDFSTGRRENLHASAEVVELDIAHEGLAAVLDHFGPDAVVHQAAQPAMPRSLAEPLLDCRSNILGTLNLLECCRQSGVRRVVMASSAAVYGEPEQVPLQENAATRPLSPYGLSKLTAEAYGQLYNRLHGMDVVALRYANVYGPRQDTRGEAGVVCLFITQMLQAQQPVIHGDGRQTRDLVFVEDVARANLLALAPEVPSGVYNVGRGTGTDILTLFDLLNRGRLPRVHSGPRPGDIRHSVLDSSAFQRVSGWRALVPLDEGLARTVAHFQTGG